MPDYTVPVSCHSYHPCRFFSPQVMKPWRLPVCALSYQEAFRQEHDVLSLTAASSAMIPAYTGLTGISVTNSGYIYHVIYYIGLPALRAKYDMVTAELTSTITPQRALIEMFILVSFYAMELPALPALVTGS